MNVTSQLIEVLRKAIALAEIASDWNLDEVWIDGVQYDTGDLIEEFKNALAAAGEQV